VNEKNTTGETLDTPEGKIRPGDRVPYKKPTRDEIERRILLVKRLIARRAYACEITTLLRARYGVCRATAWNYIQRARLLICEEAGTTPEQARADAVNFYLTTIRESEDERVRMEAQQRLDWVFGVHPAPKAPVGPDGQPVPPATVNITQVRACLGDERGRQMLAELSEYAAGLPTPAEYRTEELPPDVAARMQGGAPPA
jgi:hypothetical protein